MLFLKQIQEVGGGADAEKPLDGVEYDINSALRSHADQAILHLSIRLKADTTLKSEICFCFPQWCPALAGLLAAPRWQAERVECPFVFAPACLHLDVQVEKHFGVEEGLELLSGRGADRFDLRAALADDDRLLRLPLDENGAIQPHQAFRIGLFKFVDDDGG